MLRNRLLEGIWSGSITARPASDPGPISRAVAEIVKIPTISLTGTTRLAGLRMLPESTELLPGLSLGDVLAEELGLDVPYGAIVIFEAENDVEPIDTAQLRTLVEWALLEVLMPVRSGSGTPGASAREIGSVARALFQDESLNARFFPPSHFPGPEAEIEQRAAG